MISGIISRISILVFGTLYPAYASYKAVRTKNVKEYVKWMMYWIVYAFFTCIETFTDIFLAWFPFYYEVKVLVVLWLLSPATKGSSVLYRKFVHPMLTRREQEIDEYLNQAKERGYTAVIQLGSKGVNYATNVIMQTALKTLQVPNGFSSVEVAPQNRRPLPTSHSDYEISRRIPNSRTVNSDHDTHDGPNNKLTTNRMLRSYSVDMDLVQNYNEESSQRSSEEEFEIGDEVSEMNINGGGVHGGGGAARLRELPKRKTATRASSVPQQIDTDIHAQFKKKNSGKLAIRGRRRIKNTPDPDVYVD